MINSSPRALLTQYWRRDAIMQRLTIDSREGREPIKAEMCCSWPIGRAESRQKNQAERY